MGKRKKTILALSFSPRKGGNSDILCDEAIQGALAAGATVEKLHMAGKTVIKPCVACEWCHKSGKGYCVFPDDMTPLYPLLRKCDGLILAGPIYFFTVSAQMKLFLDKLYPMVKEDGLKIGPKRVLACFTYAADDALESGCNNAAHTLHDIFAYGKVPVSFVHGSAPRKGAIRKNRAVMRAAKEAGRELAQGI